MSPVPTIDAITRRLSECPPEFLAEPRMLGEGKGIRIAAVVADLLEALGAQAGQGLRENEAEPLEKVKAADRNLVRLMLVASWVCHDAWLRGPKTHAPKVKEFLLRGLKPLADLVNADLFVTDPDRREELARSLLGALALCPGGETVAQASDRLKSLSTVERAKVVTEMKAAQERARKLREQMAAEAARQSASRYSSE